MVYKGVELPLSEQEFNERALSIYIEPVRESAGLMSDVDCASLEEAAKDMVMEYYLKK